MDDCIRVLCNPTADNVSVHLWKMCLIHIETKADRRHHPPSHLLAQQRTDECALTEKIWDKSVYMLYSQRQIVHILRVYTYLRDRNEVLVVFVPASHAEPSAGDPSLLPSLRRRPE